MKTNITAQAKFSLAQQTFYAARAQMSAAHADFHLMARELTKKTFQLSVPDGVGEPYIVDPRASTTPAEIKLIFVDKDRLDDIGTSSKRTLVWLLTGEILDDEDLPGSWPFVEATARTFVACLHYLIASSRDPANLFLKIEPMP